MTTSLRFDASTAAITLNLRDYKKIKEEAANPDGKDKSYFIIHDIQRRNTELWKTILCSIVSRTIFTSSLQDIPEVSGAYAPFAIQEGPSHTLSSPLSNRQSKSYVDLHPFRSSLIGINYRFSRAQRSMNCRRLLPPSKVSLEPIRELPLIR